MMESRYHVADTSQIITPAMLVFREVLEANLDQMIAIAGDVSRLREILAPERDATEARAATLAESAERLEELEARRARLAGSIP